MKKRVEIQVPASISNLGSGFGVLGLALELFRVSIVIGENDGNNLEVKNLESDYYREVISIAQNIYGELANGYGLKGKYVIEFKEYYPVHYGLGLNESIALAVCYGLALISDIELTDYEILTISSNSLKNLVFWDHLAASYYGGFTLINKNIEPPSLIRVEPPDWLEIILLVPKMGYASWWRKINSKLKVMKFTFEDISKETSSLATLIQGLMNNDIDALSGGLGNSLFINVVFENSPYLKEITNFLIDKGLIGFMISREAPTVALFFNELQTNIDNIFSRLKAFIDGKRIPYEVFKTTWSTGLSSNP